MGVKQTLPIAVQMSAYDPKRTLRKAALPACSFNAVRCRLERGGGNKKAWREDIVG
jgi:hypothetical protein